MPFTLEPTVWTKPGCVNCDRTMYWLDNNDNPYWEEDITAPENAEKLQEFRELGVLEAPIVEVWEYIFDEGEWIQDSLIERWTGFDPDKLEQHFGQ